MMIFCRSHYLSLLALGAVVLLSACSTNRATGNQSFTAFMSEDEEKKVGATEHPKIIKGFGGEYPDAALQSYVNRIGKGLAAVSEVPDLAYTFTILNDPKVNAFALPGGYVYITRGLLALAENEAEMAGVLAHEIGHITARHSAQRHSTTMATNIGLTVLGVIGSAVGVPSGLGQAVSMGAQAVVQGYSREQELEADMLGVRYISRLGYSPDGMTTFFKKLDAHSKLEAKSAGEEGVSHNIMSTHPRTSDRITQAIHLAKTKKVDNPLIQRDAYLAQIDGIVFGDDPSQGVRKGRRFIHPSLRIEYVVPPDFVLFNSTKNVTAIGPDDARIIFDMANPDAVRQAGSLRQYLEAHWGRNINPQGVESLEINGMAAVTGAGQLKASAGTRDVRLLVMEGDKDKIFQLAFITPPQSTEKLSTEFRRTTYSFRRLSLSEAAAVRPLKIRTHKVRQGESVASLAKDMPVEKYQQEWFRILNSLDENQQPSAGQTVKLIAE